MARCEECIHEKVCLHKANIQTDTYAYMGVSYDTESCEHFKHTSDVVPKSEVESLIYKLECLLCHSTGGMLSKYSYDFQTMESAVTDYINKVYYEGYDEAKAEVAREIFEEIEKEIDSVRGLNFALQSLDHFIAELKNKYQEGERS